MPKKLMISVFISLSLFTNSAFAEETVGEGNNQSDCEAKKNDHEDIEKEHAEAKAKVLKNKKKIAALIEASKSIKKYKAEVNEASKASLKIEALAKVKIAKTLAKEKNISITELVGIMKEYNAKKKALAQKDAQYIECIYQKKVAEIIAIGRAGEAKLCKKEDCIANEKVIYVNANNTNETQDGKSWETAYTDLQEALKVAKVGNNIWVAKGVYKPYRHTVLTNKKIK